MVHYLHSFLAVSVSLQVSFAWKAFVRNAIVEQKWKYETKKKTAATTATAILALNSLSSQWKCSKLFINMMCGTVYAPCAYFHSQISHENLFIRWKKITFFVSDILRRHLMKSTSFCCRARFRSSSLKSCSRKYLQVVGFFSWFSKFMFSEMSKVSSSLIQWCYVLIDSGMHLNKSKKNMKK